MFSLPRLSRSGPVLRAWLATHIAPWLPVLLLVLLLGIPPVVLTWLVFFTDQFTVQAVTVTDAREHTTTAAREIVTEQLAAVPFQHNIFFVPTDVIEAALINALPQVRTVHVVRTLPGTIKVIIQEKTPALLLLSGGRYYFVDSDGVAYEEARLDTLPGTVLPTLKNTDASSRVTPGVPVVSPSFLTFIQQVQEQLPEYTGVQAAEIRMPSLSSREVHVGTNANWEIKFDVTRDAPSQLRILQLLLDNNISAAEREVLEYIDLRIPGRVYYRAGGAALAEPAATPAP